MKNWQHPNWVAPTAEVNELCPKCDDIVNYGYQKVPTPEMCPKCGYDLRRPVGWFKQFRHRWFWGTKATKYPLGFCKSGYDEIRKLKESFNG